MSANDDFHPLTRRAFVHAGVGVAVLMSSGKTWSAPSGPKRQFEHGNPLLEPGYGQVQFEPGLHQAQLEQTHSILMALDNDSLLRPFRLAAGLPAPGSDLGGWYSTGWGSFGPTTFGQWISALSRYYAISRDEPTRLKIGQLLEGFAATLNPPATKVGGWYGNTSYTYDKLVCGLEDAFHFADQPQALDILAKVTDLTQPFLPGHAIDMRLPDQKVPEGAGESYTLPENQFIAWQRCGDERYLRLARAYMNDSFFDPLAQGRNVLARRHAYSHVNSLSSAVKAYLVLGDEKYLRAAINGFDFVEQQSFVTGAWGPGESFLPVQLSVEARQALGVDVDVLKDRGDAVKYVRQHFETPCGAYAHFKLTRYLLRITKDPRYGDSMERMMYNTVLGALPLNKFGKAFYQSNYHSHARKEYFNGYGNVMEDEWPCCSGTLPQVAADYRISTYFRDPDGVFVNLYIPSTLRWEQRGAQISLTQSGRYPLDDGVALEVTTSRPASFAIRLRIPHWAREASIRVNGRRISQPVRSGTFATVRREWKSGDRVELQLPRRLELQAADAQSPDTVALVCGPLVLFAATDDTPKVTRAQLLAARQQGEGSAEWRADSASGPLRLTPFWAIKDEIYFTYFSV